MEAALQVRRNAEEAARQMQELLQWEKNIKVAAPAQASVPIKAAIRGTPSDSTSKTSLEDALVLKEKGNAYFKMNLFDKAERSYSKALSLLPNDLKNSAVIYGNRAMTYLKLQNYEKAVDDCSRVLDIDAKNVKALWRRGVAKAAIGKDLQSAKEDFDKALVLEPTNAVVKQELLKLAARISESKTVRESRKTDTVIEKKELLRKRVEIVEVGDAALYTPPIGKESKSLFLELSQHSAVDVEPSSIRGLRTIPVARGMIISSFNVISGFNWFDKNLTESYVNSVPNESQADRTLARGSERAQKSMFVLKDTSVGNVSDKAVHIAANVEEKQKPKLLIEEIPENSTPDADIIKELGTGASSSEQPAKPPANFIEFELEWKLRKTDPRSLYSLFKVFPVSNGKTENFINLKNRRKSIEPSSYKRLFKSSMEYEHLCAILRLLNDYYIEFVIWGIFFLNIVPQERKQATFAFRFARTGEC
ncbi:Protein unc-45 B [Entophlyctis luteolus]|nr:Protein unc-45 B [Entophlyctis luteolus]